jgi:ARG and Rhodanese-Phosphatase-superfamily-associated Protein domain
MTTHIAPSSTLPFQLGEPRSFRGLTTIPLFPAGEPALEYIGLDEAVSRGLEIAEVGSDGIVGLLAVSNPLDDHVLLYEGEELVGAKQNRILGETILVEAKSTLKVPATCVERGRWSHRSERFAPAPRAAYPALRKAQRLGGQGAAWADISARSAILDATSPTEAAEAMFEKCATPLLQYAKALPRAEGQSGVLVGIGGRISWLDYVSRSDVFAGLYAKLLNGYALDAIGASDRPLPRTAVGRFLGELELAERTWRPAVGLGEAGELVGYTLGRELTIDGAVVSLSAFPAR